MSLVRIRTVKPSCCLSSEGGKQWLKTSKEVSLAKRRIRESGINSCDVTIDRHGGVRGGGMFGSNMETSREILTDAPDQRSGRSNTHDKLLEPVSMKWSAQEVGVVHSSASPARERSSCNGSGAKGPHLVNVNREVKALRWLENRY